MSKWVTEIDLQPILIEMWEASEDIGAIIVSSRSETRKQSLRRLVFKYAFEPMISWLRPKQRHTWANDSFLFSEMLLQEHVRKD